MESALLCASNSGLVWLQIGIVLYITIDFLHRVLSRPGKSNPTRA
jgi:hypothetical protein